MKETPVFSTAAVVAPHALAAQAGRDILAQGGNALEAMVAMAASVAVAYPHMNGIGGDGFWVIRTPDGKVRAIEACGFAGEKATIPAYRAKGYENVPPRGADAALTVAGAIGGWIRALDLSAAVSSQLPLRILLEAAIAQARAGVPISTSEGRYSVKEREAILAAPGFASHFAGKDGKQPEAGSIRTQPALAATFEQLSHAGFDDFYRGDIAREIAADLDRVGAPVTRSDLKRYEARWREPLQVRVRDMVLYNCPSPTQGIASLMLHAIFDQIAAPRAESVAHLHGLIEAGKRAYAIRDRIVTDFDHMRVDPLDMLNPAAIAKEAAAIRMDRAAEWPFVSADGDTIWMGAIDGSGLAVSFIQSLFWEYGSGVVLPGTGILWQNRGMAFSLDPQSLNPLQPGRRPFHTLNCPLAVFDDGRVSPYGAMGGDGQPQFQAQVFFRAIRYGMSISEALDRPRYLFGRGWGQKSATLKIENRFDGAVISSLEKLGHEIERIDRPYADMFGHAGMLVRDQNGQVSGDHDPRADGGAMGI
ncbi:Ggt Gamma-glutamyltransferase [Rhabdaerophilaceae bacterium]